MNIPHTKIVVKAPKEASLIITLNSQEHTDT